MCWKGEKRILLALMVLLLGALTPACTAQAERETVEAELALFMRDHIVNEYLDTLHAYLAPGAATGATEEEVPGIIVWAPPGRNPHSPSEFVQRDQPIRVWLFAGGQLSEPSDMIEAIEQYQQTYILHQQSEIWAFYDYAIESITRNGQQAEVYLGVTCGPLCGIGYRYTLERSSSGEWEIIDTETVWIM